MNQHHNAHVASQHDATHPDVHQHDTTRHDAEQETSSDAQTADHSKQHEVPTSDHQRSDENMSSQRPDTSRHVETRTDAESHDTTRPDVNERDTARHNASKDNASELADDVTARTTWLDIEETARELKQRGIPRSVRTIQRMCQRSKLVCKLVPTETGARYIIDSSSIDAFEQSHNETLPTAGSFAASRTSREEVGEDSLTQSKTSGEPNSRAQPSASAFSLEQATGHAQEIISLKDRHIALLEDQLKTANGQIAMKDEQIHAMLERDHETNVLIQNLQGLMALPEGRTRPNAQPQNTHPQSSSIDADTNTISGIG